MHVGLVATFVSFLSDRTIQINFGSFVSKPFQDQRGIGQGTVNGPALFMCFFDKVKHLLHDCYHLSFADDLAIYISDTDANNGIDRIQKILCRLDKWFISVGLTMSYCKTKLMVIRK